LLAFGGGVILPDYLVLALSAGGTGAGQNKYTFVFFLPLALMSLSFATEVFF